jgi:hypothetical protein
MRKELPALLAMSCMRFSSVALLVDGDLPSKSGAAECVNWVIGDARYGNAVRW